MAPPPSCHLLLYQMLTCQLCFNWVGDHSWNPTGLLSNCIPGNSHTELDHINVNRSSDNTYKAKECWTVRFAQTSKTIMGWWHYPHWTEKMPQFRCSIFKCGTWWSAVYCTIGYPKMWVSALHHGLWPFFTVDQHPRVDVHRPTGVCSSHNYVGLQGIPLNLSLNSPPSQSTCTQANRCPWLTQSYWAVGNPPPPIPLLTAHYNYYFHYTILIFYQALQATAWIKRFLLLICLLSCSVFKYIRTV